MATKIKRLDLSVGGVDYYLEQANTKKVELSYSTDGYFLSPNQFYVLGNPKDGEYFTIMRKTVDENEGISNHYMLRFTYPEDCPGVIFSDWPLTWYGGSAPEWVVGNTYEISILDNIALFAELEPNA